jgi:carbonic anhydrase
MSALLIACSDGRIADELLRLQKRLHAEDADRMLVPGGPLVLTATGAERRVALDCVKSIIDVNNVRQVLLVSHQDCWAYERALGGIGFDQQEILARDLRRVRTLIENQYPGVEVYCYVIPWREDGGGKAAFGEAERVD